MAKIKFSKSFKASIDKDKWNAICPPMEYRVINGIEANSLGLVPTSMKQVNSVAIGASGSLDNTIMYFANYFRLDGKEIDQEPYFEIYESGSFEPSLYGIFHHSKFSGRTEILTTSEIEKIAASGSNADIQFTAKPNSNSGYLKDLRTEGKIIGFDYTWSEAMKQKKKQ